jgi:protein-disulfide isomerase
MKMLILSPLYPLLSSTQRNKHRDATTKLQAAYNQELFKIEQNNGNQRNILGSFLLACSSSVQSFAAYLLDEGLSVTVLTNNFDSEVVEVVVFDAQAIATEDFYTVTDPSAYTAFF